MCRREDQQAQPVRRRLLNSFMKRKGLSIVVIIPLIVLSLVIAGVFGYKLYSDMTATRARASEIPKTLPNIAAQSAKKPTSGYGSVKAPSPTPKPVIDIRTLSSPDDFEAVLEDMTDDGGQREMNDVSDDIKTL